MTDLLAIDVDAISHSHGAFSAEVPPSFDFEDAPEEQRDPGLISVLSARFDDAKAAFEKLSKKAARFGTGPLTFRVIGTHVEKRLIAGGKKIDVEFTDVEVRGATPRVGNYEFLAKIEFVNRLPIVCKAPGAEAIVEDRYLDNPSYVCEHCRTDRVRHEVFIVRSVETGVQLQVGRSCLKDFLGFNDVQKAIASFSYFGEARGGFNEFGSSFSGFPVVEVLAATSACIRRWGWVPKSFLSGRPTAYRVASLFSRATDEETKAERAAVSKAMTEADWELAEKVVEWGRSGLLGRSEYERGLVALLAGDYAPRLGFLASAVPAYLKAQELAVKRVEEKKETLNSSYIGTEGTRLRGVELTVRSVRGIETAYGSSKIIKLLTAEGNLVVWFTGSYPDLEAGSKIVADFTVKGHKEYQGVKETSVTRLSVKEEKK